MVGISLLFLGGRPPEARMVFLRRTFRICGGDEGCPSWNQSGCNRPYSVGVLRSGDADAEVGQLGFVLFDQGFLLFFRLCKSEPGKRSEAASLSIVFMIAALTRAMHLSCHERSTMRCARMASVGPTGESSLSRWSR